MEEPKATSPTAEIQVTVESVNRRRSKIRFLDFEKNGVVVAPREFDLGREGGGWSRSQKENWLKEKGIDLMVMGNGLQPWRLLTPVDNELKLVRVAADTLKKNSDLNWESRQPEKGEALQFISEDMELIEHQLKSRATHPDHTFLFTTADGTRGLLKFTGHLLAGGGDPIGLKLVFKKLPQQSSATTSPVQQKKDAASFGIYLMEEQVPSQLAVYGKGDWKNIRLLDAPIITADDIERYEWNNHRLVFRAAVRERLPRPPVQGLGFVVVVNGERIYPGLFTTAISSFSFALPNICVENLNETGNSVVIDRAYPGDSFGVGADPRTDERVRTALDALGKLDGRKKFVGGEMGKAPYESLTITTNDVVRFIQPGVGMALVKFQNLDGPEVKFESRWKRSNGKEGAQSGTLRQSKEGGWQTPVIVHAGEKLSFEWSEGGEGKAFIYFDPTSQKATLLDRVAFDAGF